MTDSLLSLAHCLPVVVLALASGASAVAQPDNITPNNFQVLYTAVESRGKTLPVPGYVADALAMLLDDPLCCRQAPQGIAQRHMIVGIQYQSHQYLAFVSHSGTDHWLFLMNDVGKPAVTLDAVVPDGSYAPTWRTLTPSEAQPLVAAEEAFWLKRVENWPFF